MPCIYLVYAALASRRADQTFSLKIRKLWKYYLFTDYMQKRDQKSEILECIRKNVSGEKKAIPIRFAKVSVIIHVTEFTLMLLIKAANSLSVSTFCLQ